jgi:hypothetical protein
MLLKISNYLQIPNGLVSFFGAVALVSLLTACTPAFNWREVMLDQESARIQLPEKPSVMERDITLDGLKVKMQMKGALVNGIAFIAALVNLPDRTEATAQKALAAMRLQMTRNIQGAETSAREVAIAVLDGSGQIQSKRLGTLVIVKGQMQNKAAQMTAGFVAYQGIAFQWVAMGPIQDQSLPEQEIKNFIDSFKLMQRQ